MGRTYLPQAVYLGVDSAFIGQGGRQWAVEILPFAAFVV